MITLTRVTRFAHLVHMVVLPARMLHFMTVNPVFLLVTFTFLSSISAVHAMKDVLSVKMKLFRTAADAIQDITFGKAQHV